jgi:hypothetical protein
LGNQIDLNFNSVFGNQATIANTNGNIFSAYQPSGTTSSTGTGRTGAGSGTAGGGFTGGFGTTTGTGSGLGGGTLGTTGLGGNTGNRVGGTGAGLTGTLGGGLGGGALGNRNALGGGMNAQGGNRNMFGGGQNFLGGGQNFLGGGAAGNFLGSSAQQQQGNNTVGYQVNVDRGPSVGGSNLAVTPNADIQQRLMTAPGLQGGISNLQVTQRGETAILRGQVNSDYARQLAAAMVRLEPGVYEVDNQLEVVAGKK